MKRTRVLIISLVSAAVLCAGLTATALAMTGNETGDARSEAIVGAPGPEGPVAVTPTSNLTTTTELPKDGSQTVSDGRQTPSTEEDGETDSGDKPHPFGQYVSSLRHAGDHTPAAELQGKNVPGQEDGDKTKPHTPAAVEKGKKVPGWSRGQ